MHNAYRHMSEDGKDELMSGFLPLNQYLEEYERLSGLSVDPKRLQYYRVLVSYMSVVICGGTGYRVSLGCNSPLDFVFAPLAMFTHPFSAQMLATSVVVLFLFSVSFSHCSLRSRCFPFFSHLSIFIFVKFFFV